MFLIFFNEVLSKNKNDSISYLTATKMRPTLEYLLAALAAPIVAHDFHNKKHLLSFTRIF